MTEQPPIRLRRHLVAQWLTLVLTLLMLGGTIGYFLYREYVSVGKREQERLRTQIRVIDDNLSRQLCAAYQALLGFREDLPTIFGVAGYPGVNRRLKSLCEAMPGMRTIIMLDTQGKVLASNRQELIGVDLSYRDYFKIIKLQHDPAVLYVTPPFKTTLGVFGMNVSLMIPGPKGEFAGLVSATLNPEYFTTLLSSVLYAPDMWTAVAHGDGLQFLMVPEREGMGGINLTKPGSFFTRHRESGKSENVLSGLVYATGEERLMAMRTIKPANAPMDKPLVVAISRDLNGIYNQWRKDARAQGILYSLITLAAVLGLYIYQRRQRYFERREAEAARALQESAERLKLAAEAAGLGVWEYDLVTRRLAWDEAMFTIYGVDPAAFSHTYEAWRERLLPEDLTRVEEELHMSTQATRPLNTLFRIVRGDGDIRTIRAMARIFYGESGRPLRLIGTNEDVTEQQQAEVALRAAKDAAEAADRMKTDFLANMTHEIRTPMNSVLGLTQLLLDADASPQQQYYLQMIYNSSKALLNIINDILDYSKMEARRLELEKIDFHLDGILRNIADLFSFKAEEKGLKIFFEVGTAVPATFTGDPLRLAQILNNLVGNAVKFTPSGDIHIKVDVLEIVGDQALLRFEVRDTGIGLSAEEIEHLFQAFSQADTSISRKYGGTGLGLTISRRLVQLMGGKIDVESTPGQGSIFRFTVRLPIVPAIPESRSPNHLRKPDYDNSGGTNDALVTGGSWREKAKPIRGTRVLLVEDNFANQQVALAFLTKMGLIVDIAGNGREAVERVAGVDYDAVLMDLQMPEMDGYQATAIIRESERGKALPVIAMTAAAMAMDRIAAEAAGMNGFVAKPIDPVRLIDELLKFIQPCRQPQTMIGSPEMSGSDFDLARAAGDLETLLTILKKNRAVPDDLVTSLRSQLANHPTTHLMEASIRQINVFDFDSARATVEKIINEVKR